MSTEPLRKDDPLGEPAVDAPELYDGELEEEYVPEDDKIIGKAFRWSLIGFAAVGLVVAVVIFIVQRPQEQAAVTEIVSEAPEAVVSGVEAPAVRFADITAAAGISFTHTNGAYGEKLLPETMGGGVAFFDYDADADADLLFVNSSYWPHKVLGQQPTMALYRNDGGRFTDVTKATGLDVSFYGMGAATADYDADGDLDIFFTTVGPNRLFRNDGNRFTEVTGQAGVAGRDAEWSSSAGFFDFDGDGWLDLMVCNYVRWSKEIDFEIDFRLTGVGRAFGPPQNYEGTFPYLYRNNGDGTFSDVTDASGLKIKNPATDVPMAKSLALAPVDIDRDGLMDVLVANDTVQNFFFHNQGGGTFEEVAEIFGVAYDRNGNATGAMGVDVAHFRNDENLGFLIGNFANEMTSVYVSQDDPTFFADEAIAEGIGATSRRMLTFGLFLFDYDLDGRLDMLQANGHIEEDIGKVDPSQNYLQPAQLFWNAGLDSDRGFVSIEPEFTGDLAQEIVGRGAAFADIDADGDLDVVLTQIAGPALLLRNEQDLGNHWLRLKLIGKAPNRDAIGAWVEVTAGGTTQRRQVMPTRSYLSQVELPVTVGLGEAQQIDAIEVLWADGTTQTVPPPASVDQLIVIEQTT